MRLWNQFCSRMLALMGRRRMENEMDAELRFHLEARADDLMRGGVGREEALRRARIEFVESSVPKRNAAKPVG